MKDFAKTWEQKSWEYAVNTHFRMKNLLAGETHLYFKKYAEEKIEQLEEKYPQLKINNSSNHSE